MSPVDKLELISEKFAQNLSLWRVSKEKTQANLASEIGVSLRKIQRLESGEVRPGLTEILRICHYLGLKFEDLICFIDENDGFEPVSESEISHYLGFQELLEVEKQVALWESEGSDPKLFMDRFAGTNWFSDPEFSPVMVGSDFKRSLYSSSALRMLGASGAKRVAAGSTIAKSSEIISLFNRLAFNPECRFFKVKLQFTRDAQKREIPFLGVRAKAGDLVFAFAIVIDM